MRFLNKVNFNMIKLNFNNPIEKLDIKFSKRKYCKTLTKYNIYAIKFNMFNIILTRNIFSILLKLLKLTAKWLILEK